ncbi:MAG: M3 family oligoendopeptidase [Erysipelotrichaceae bacterium]|nr:M3 family oligoendopeptidase [Erysipelotrichaceae bacterium]
MNKEWSLDVLYKGYDDPNFQEDEKQLDELIKEFVAFAEDLNGDPKDVLVRSLYLVEKLNGKASDLFSFASLSQATNTSDTKAAAILGRLSSKMSALAVPNTALTKYVAGLEDLDAVIASDPLLKEHEFYLKNIKESAGYTLSPEVEKVISLYEISGSSAWSDLQSFLTSTVPVEYKGKTTSLSDIRNMAYDPDPEVRKSAYEAELKSYDRIKDAIAFSLNSIKAEVIRHCELRGYESPLDETLKNAHMKKETLDALLGAMEEYLPKFWEYMKAKAKMLGHENGLPFYELFAPLKGNEKEYTTQDARDYLVDLFSTFDAEETEMIARAFDEAWIDFYPHDGKVGGAFCAELNNQKQSRILTNFGGQLGDVITLAHELGHAFHNYCLKDNSLLNRDVSMPVAETASTFNEVVAMNAAISMEKDPIARRALIENQLQDANQIICDIYSRYLFERSVFENRDKEFMFADRLCELMLDAQKKAYGDGLDPAYLHPYMWCCKGHYYSGHLSYYNFPYAFGGLFARGLYAKYLKEGESFVPLYKKLLKATGTTTVEGAAEVAGIDLTDKEFWRSSLQILADEIDEFIELCKE